MAPATFQRYRKAFLAFTSFARAAWHALPSEPAQLDLCLCIFIESLWQEGFPQSDAINAISGVAFFIPSVRFALPRSRQFLRAWKRAELPRRAFPLRPEHVFAMAGAAIAAADQRFALAISLAFHCLLRADEILSVTPACWVPHPSRSSAILVLPRSKGFSRTGNQESVVVSDPLLVKFGSAVFAGIAPHEHLLPFADPRFLATFRSFLDRAGVPPGTWSLHSLRRGGATHLFAMTSSFDRVASIGRWTQVRTARVYINESLALLSSIHETRSHTRRMLLCTARLRQFFLAL